MGGMRGVVILVVCLIGPSAARGGLYSTAEPRWSLGGDLPPSEYQRFKEFQDKTLIPLRQIVSQDSKSPLHKQYTLIAALAGTAPRGKLSVEQQLDLGACLIRLGKHRDAVSILSQAQFRERDNFLLLANLATAEQLDGQLRRAHDYLAEALRLWPENWNDLPEPKRKWLEKYYLFEPDHLWYRPVESYHLRLLKLRMRERAGDGLPEAPDALFDRDGKAPVKFVGESGRFEAGKIAAAERAKLPKNALETAQQLLVWFPHDMRLYWLLGELFNAEGNVDAAREIFEEIAGKWNPATDKTFGAKKNPSYPRLFKEHLDVLKAQPRTVTFGTGPEKDAKVDTEPPPAGIDWTALAIGFAAGVLFSLFAYWQIREIRRRRQMRSVLKTSGE
jgi:tetratricopeptide (TPR) repeat protein